MIIRVSFMVIASVAALKISQIKRNENKGSECSHLEHEFEERKNSTANTNHSIQNEEKMQVKTDIPENLLQGKFDDCKLLIGGEKMDYVTEKKLLENLIQNYKHEEENLERKLIELNSLKEEKSAIAQMQRELGKKVAKVDCLKFTIHSLQSESKVIQEKIRENVLCKVQLEIANKIINEMQLKKDNNRSHVKDQILSLQQQVIELQKKDMSRNAVVNKKLGDVQDIELEVLELKRRNKELEFEKREVGIKLATALERIMTEEEIVAQIQEEITGLRHVNEELSEQVENLQRNRFDMVEELVYQRWLYTCLRFEANRQQKQIRKASIQDYIKKSDKENSDSELDSISSNATFTESDEIETTILERSSSSQSSNSNKNSSFLNKIKRWKKGKDYINKISPKGRSSPTRNSAIRRFSMSAVESDSSVMKYEKPMTRLRRVSFSDSVKPSSFHDMKEEVEDVIDDKETNSVQIVEMASTITSSDEHKAEQNDELCKLEKYADEGTMNQSGHSGELCSKNEIFCRKHERIKSQLVKLLVVFFFLLILLAYFRTI